MLNIWKVCKGSECMKMLQSIIWGFTAFVGIPIWKNSGDPTIFLMGYFSICSDGLKFGMANEVLGNGYKKGMRSICSCCRHGCAGKQLVDTDGTEFVLLNTHVQVERFDLFVVLSLVNVLGACHALHLKTIHILLQNYYCCNYHFRYQISSI